MTISKRLSKKSRVLSVDPSASHLAFTISEIDPGNSLKIVEVGMIWADSKWELGQRLNYMYNCLEYLITGFDIDSITTEAFFSNPKMKMGQNIIPTINHFMQVIIYKSGKVISYEEISPSAWRKVLGIKADIVGNKRDFKAPTKRIVQTKIGALPDEIISNITGNLRSLPTDVPDSIAMSIYVGLEHNVRTLDVDSKLCYNKYSNEFKELINAK